MADSMALPKQVLLYCVPPFFAHPLKPLLNVAIGSPYAKAYEHFIADHSTPLNLILHFMCLGFQLCANFAFLAELDQKLDNFLYPVAKGKKRTSTSGGWLVTSTAIIWSLYLFTNALIEGVVVSDVPVLAPPLVVRACACGCVLLASQVGPLVRSYWVGLVGMEAVIVGLAIEALVLKKSQPFGTAFFIAAAVHLAIWRLLSTSGRGYLKTSKYLVISCYLLVMTLVCTKSDPVAPVVFLGSFLSWPLALLCDEPALAFYGMGYLATASQGVSHELSGESATLIRLNEEAANSGVTQALAMQAAKVKYEWSHVTNFPNLALHATFRVFFPQLVQE